MSETAVDGSRESERRRGRYRVHGLAIKAKRIVDDAILVSGGSSYYSSNELSRLYRDVLAGQFHPSDPESVHATVATAWLGPLQN